jgi:predicted RNA binding protein YcfA (HicA-like mRNA interferase family)
MKSVPRDVGAEELVRKLRRMGYRKAKQEGSHISCVHEVTKHRVIVPRKNAIRVGTLQDIIRRLAAHWKKGEDEIIDMLEL